MKIGPRILTGVVIMPHPPQEVGRYHPPRGGGEVRLPPVITSDFGQGGCACLPLSPGILARVGAVITGDNGRQAEGGVPSGIITLKKNVFFFRRRSAQNHKETQKHKHYIFSSQKRKNNQKHVFFVFIIGPSFPVP